MAEAHKEPDAAYDTFLSVRRFGSLDGLRCLSIFGVLWHHSGFHYDFLLLNRGEVGVELFFAISGFLITTLMIRERRKYGQISLRKFYMRRSLRIFPLYYAVLVAYTIAVLVFERDSEAGREYFQNLPAFLTYTSNWFVVTEPGERVIFYFAWSLAVEEQFYLTWPWIERYLKPKLKLLALFALIAIVAANHFGLLLWAIPSDTLFYRMLKFIAPCILLGVLSAHVLHHPRGFAMLYSVIGRRWSSPLALALVLGVLSAPIKTMVWQYVTYVSLVTLVIACTIREDNGLARILQFKPCVRMGVVSYGIYLMHMLCYNVVEKAGPAVGLTNPWLAWVAGMLLVYVVAEVSFHTYERFFQNLKSRFSRR